MSAVLKHPVWPRYPFREMGVGDSRFILEHQEKVIRAACMYAKRNGVRFTTRKVKENGVCGTRVWRVA